MFLQLKKKLSIKELFKHAQNSATLTQTSKQTKKILPFIHSCLS